MSKVRLEVTVTPREQGAELFHDKLTRSQLLLSKITSLCFQSAVVEAGHGSYMVSAISRKFPSI